MTTRPANSPLYATDATLSGGPQVGLSTRLSPGAGALAQGFWKGRRLPARALSYILGNQGDWIAYLDEQVSRAAMQFTRTDLAVGSSFMTRLSAMQQTLAIGSAANRQKQILVSGVNGSAQLQISLLNDGTTPPASFSTSLHSNGAPSSPASDAGGTIFFGLSGTFGIKQTTNGGASAASVTVTGMVGEATWVGMTNARYLVFEGSTSKMYRAAAMGGTWTASVLSGLLSISNMVAGGTTSQYVLVGNGAASTIYTFYTTDGGVSWVAGTTLGSGAADVTYSEADGLFYCLTSAGSLYSSPTGAVWTLIKTIANLTTAAGVVLGQNCFVSCGAVLAVIVARGANSSGKYGNGIAYTLDKGATWHEIYFGSPANAPITQILSANGRIYAIDGTALYQSGLLVTPPALLTGV